VFLFFFGQNFCRGQRIFAMAFVFLLVSTKCLAITTAVLPAGVYSPAIRYGHVSGLDQRFTDNGTLVSLTDYHSIDLDAKTLSKINPEAKNLVNSLNRFGAFKMGDALNLGVLEIQTHPEIDYTAPVLAKGITNRWTLGVGLPVIHYKNDVSVSQTFSNLGYYKKQFSGLSKDLDQALNTNIGESTQELLQQRGYSRLESRDENFLGDLQMVSLYKLYESSHWTLIHQATLTLPTGPGYDPNDLLALNSFHKTAIENSLAFSRQLTANWKLTPYVSFKYTLPQKINARVPTNEDDFLPDQNSIESVEWQEGLAYEIGLQNTYEFNDRFQISLDYHLGYKDTDRFSGSESSRYDLLSRNTLTRWQKTSLEFAYSNVKSYFQNAIGIPFILSLNFFDTLAGENIERRFGQEISLTVFF
jgi:hypothetical protein